MRHPTRCVFLTSWLLTAACTQSLVAPSPDARYVQTLQAKFNGDAKAYYDGLIALAHDAPASRAGRRARATLQGSDWFAELALLGAAGFVFAPLGGNASGSVVNRWQGEAQQTLQQIDAAQQHYWAAHRRYCKTFRECGVNVPRHAHYYFFLREDEVAGGGDSESTVEMEHAVRAVLKENHLEPFVSATRYLAVAAGNADADPGLDVWTIDEQHKLVHVTDDLL